MVDSSDDNKYKGEGDPRRSREIHEVTATRPVSCLIRQLGERFETKQSNRMTLRASLPFRWDETMKMGYYLL
jgi:hypothetical protein